VQAPLSEGSAGGSGPARVQVTAREYYFTLSRAEVPAGKVIVEFVDGGEDPHNLHLAEPAEGGEAGSFPTSSPGSHADITLDLHPGTYTLFCSLPGHEAKGMKATLTVR
jgi:plastocyanin